MKYLWPIIVLLLSACVSMPEPTQQHVDMEKASAESRVACYQKAAVAEARITAMMQNVPADQRMLLIVMNQQSENNKAMLAMATGRNYDPCSEGTNYNDVAVQMVKSQGKLSESYISAAKWLGGLGLGYLAIDSIVGGAGATMTAGGDIISGSSGSGNISHAVKTNNTVIESHDVQISDDPVITSSETAVDYGDASSNDENIWGGDRTRDESTEANNDQEWAPVDDHSDNSTTRTKTKVTQ